MKVLRDPINGNVKVTDEELALIDTPQFQRMRRIRQLGFAWLAYPCATHSRFEHCVGTMFMADKMCSVVNASEKDKKILRAAALLHDLGHPPFSHHIAEFLERHTGKAHEDVTAEVISGSTDVRETLESGGYDAKDVARIAGGLGTGWKQMIVTGREASYLRKCIDADIMDYMIRDSYYTGAAYGMIDRDRLVDNLKVVKGTLVLHEKARFAIESLLLARYIMMPAIYRHRVVGIADSMLDRALERLYSEGHLNPDELWKMDEVGFISFMRDQEGYPKKIMEMIDNRRLLKLAAQVKLKTAGNDGAAVGGEEVDAKLVGKLVALRKSAKIHEIEHELAKKYKVEDGMILLDIYSPPGRAIGSGPADSILVWNEKDDRTESIEKISSIARSVAMMDWSMWYAAIYCPEDKRDHLKKKLEKDDIFKSIAENYA